VTPSGNKRHQLATSDTKWQSTTRQQATGDNKRQQVATSDNKRHCKGQQAASDNKKPEIGLKIGLGGSWQQRDFMLPRQVSGNFRTLWHL
jgi:hypothetical protein